jgi:hypothetical protein
MLEAGILNLDYEPAITGIIVDERRLRKFFHFAQDDLLANRRGQFSEGQKKRLREAARVEQASARSSAAILFVIAAAGLAIGLTISSIAPTLPGRILMFLLMGVLWPSVWAGKGVQIIRSAYALQEPQLCQVSGQARVIGHPDGSHGLQVGEYEFDLDGNPSGVIVDGDQYTLYYVKSTEEILSVE